MFTSISCQQSIRGKRQPWMSPLIIDGKTYTFPLVRSQLAFALAQMLCGLHLTEFEISRYPGTSRLSHYADGLVKHGWPIETNCTWITPPDKPAYMHVSHRLPKEFRDKIELNQVALFLMVVLATR